MSTLTAQQDQALRFLVGAVLDTIKEAGPLGAPAGPMYAALMSAGLSLSQFESLMGALCRTGKITKRGHCYHMATADTN